MSKVHKRSQSKPPKYSSNFDVADISEELKSIVIEIRRQQLLKSPVKKVQKTPTKLGGLDFKIHQSPAKRRLF